MHDQNYLLQPGGGMNQKACFFFLLCFIVIGSQTFAQEQIFNGTIKKHGMSYLQLKSEKEIHIVGAGAAIVIELKEYPKKLFMIDASNAEKYPYYKNLLKVEKRERQKQGLGFWIITSPGAKKISLTANKTKLPYTIKGYDEYYTVTDFK